MATWPGGLGQQRREPLDPPVDGDAVDCHSALSQEFFESRKDRPKRRYQRTASTITSGGKKKPAKADGTVDTGRGGQVFTATV
jgi:hypothetical protein